MAAAAWVKNAVKAKVLLPSNEAEALPFAPEHSEDLFDLMKHSRKPCVQAHEERAIDSFLRTWLVARLTKRSPLSLLVF